MTSKTLEVFLASPGGLEAERSLLRKLIGSLSFELAGTEYTFRAVGWEDVPFGSGVRLQSVFNARIDASDIFIFMVHKRWGSEVFDQTVYTSRTEEELQRALTLSRTSGRPEVLMCVKKVQDGEASPDDVQYRRVKQFLRLVEDAGNQMLHFFSGDEELQALVTREVIAAGERIARGTPRPAEFLMPVAAERMINEEIRRTRLAEARAAALAKRLVDAVPDDQDSAQIPPIAEQYALGIVLDVAQELDREGHPKAVDRLYRAAIDRTADPAVIEQAFSFWLKVNDLQQADSALRRLDMFASAEANPRLQAVATSCRAKLELAQGRITQAVALSQAAAESFERANDPLGAAIETHTLASIAANAEDPALQLSVLKRLGGVITLFEGRTMHHAHAAAISTRGLLLYALDQVIPAISSHEEAARLFNNLGDLAAESNERYNIATIYLKDPQAFIHAAEHIAAGRSIKVAIGDDAGVAKCDRLTGLLMIKVWSMDPVRPYLDRAVCALSNAVIIDRRLGRSPALAQNLLSLGKVLAWRGDFEAAADALEKAATLFAAIGQPTLNESCQSALLGVKARQAPEPPSATPIQKRSAIHYRQTFQEHFTVLDKAMSSRPAEHSAQ